jgi:hypothetical protein
LGLKINRSLRLDISLFYQEVFFYEYTKSKSF